MLRKILLGIVISKYSRGFFFAKKYQSVKIIQSIWNILEKIGQVKLNFWRLHDHICAVFLDNTMEMILQLPSSGMTFISQSLPL